MQLWWGNADQGSTMKLEYCQKTDAQSANAELMDVLKGDTIGGIAGDLFSDADLALSGCDFTTDLSGIFVKHGMVPHMHGGGGRVDLCQGAPGTCAASSPPCLHTLVPVSAGDRAGTLRHVCRRSSCSCPGNCIVSATERFCRHTAN